MNPQRQRMKPGAMTPEIVELLALSLDPVAPAAQTRSRLMNSLEGPERFAPFFAELSRLFDLPVFSVKALLAQLDNPSAWEVSLPGVRLIEFLAGPRVAAAEAGFVRLVPGAGFPRHRHIGHETTIVLEGTLIDGGREHAPGARVEHEADSVHKYFAGPGRDLVIAVLHNGLAPVD